jgi:hypothetical protein
MAGDQAARNFEASVVCVVRASQKAVADPIFLIGDDGEVVEELFPCSTMKTK